MKTSWLRGFLTIAAVVFFGAAFLFMMEQTIPDKNRDAIMILIGALITRSEKIDSFFFGSSQNSHSKDEVIAGMASGNTSQTATGRVDDPVHVVPDTLDLDGEQVP